MQLNVIDLESISKHLKNFVRHWTKEIVVGIILAVIAAFMIDSYIENYRELTAEEILNSNSKAVAVITVYGRNNEQISQGSGFFYSPDGKLVTNYHVISAPGTVEIRAQLPATRAVYFAKGYIHRDGSDDIALLQFDAKETPYIKLGDSSNIKVGQHVYTIGSPLGLENSVSEGVVSSVERQVGRNKLIQFTAPISSGNSGGGLFDKRGKAIGITSMAITGTQEEPGHNLNLAIPINLVRNAMNSRSESLPTDQASSYYFLGQLESNKHNWNKALEYFNKSITINSANVDAYVGAANALYEIGDYKSEVAYLEKAVSLDPKDYVSIFTLGTAYEDIGKYNDAIGMYNEALKIKPDDKDSLFYLAFLSVLIGDLKTAHSAEEELTKLDEGIGREIHALITLASRRHEQ